MTSPPAHLSARIFNLVKLGVARNAQHLSIEQRPIDMATDMMQLERIARAAALAAKLRALERLAPH
jgi:hypothetical protein